MGRPTLCRGYFDVLSRSTTGLRVSGWLVLPDQPLDSVIVEADGCRPTQVLLTDRPDVAAYIPWLPHAITSAFQADLPGDPQERGAVSVRARLGGKVWGSMRTWYDLTLRERCPLPPLDLIQRVAGMRNVDGFLLEGYKLFGEFVEALSRHTDLVQITSLLDWGCGCGRIAMHWPTVCGQVDVHACDIDPDAIRWCQEQLPFLRAATIPLMPRTHYGDGGFDAVVSCSVLTHLDRNAQVAWLAEVARLLKPGGLFIASVHGPSATLFAFPPAPSPDSPWWSRLLRRRTPPTATHDLARLGIFDGLEDHALDAVAPAGYYRATFQSEAYTRRSWAPWFEVLEYTVRGIGNNQDLVIGRRRTLLVDG